MGEKSIVFIMGAGRSGTTLVDMLLGNDPKLFSGGELNRIPKRNGVAPGRMNGSDAQIFWSGIKDKLLQNFDLQGIFLQSKKIEYHAGYFQKTKKLPPEYESYLRQLFKHIFETIDKEILIDSSKYPMRAYHLANLFPEEFQYCIYVKKHPVAVLRSFQKKGLEQPPKSWLVVNIYLVVVHLLSGVVTKRLRKRNIKVLEVNFEDVVDHPLVFLEQVENSFGLNLQVLRNKLKSGTSLSTNMLFDGNRIRLEKEFTVSKNKPPINWTLKEHFVYVCNSFWWKNKINEN